MKEFFECLGPGWFVVIFLAMVVVGQIVVQITGRLGWYGGDCPNRWEPGEGAGAYWSSSLWCGFLALISVGALIVVSMMLYDFTACFVCPECGS